MMGSALVATEVLMCLSASDAEFVGIDKRASAGGTEGFAEHPGSTGRSCYGLGEAHTHDWCRICQRGLGTSDGHELAARLTHFQCRMLSIGRIQRCSSHSALWIDISTSVFSVLTDKLQSYL